MCMFFYCALEVFFFNKLKVNESPALSNFIDAVFQILVFVATFLINLRHLELEGSSLIPQLEIASILLETAFLIVLSRPVYFSTHCVIQFRRQKYTSVPCI